MMGFKLSNAASKLLAGAAGFALLLFAAQNMAAAEEAAPKADVTGSASAPSHKAPLRVKVVDYQKAEEGPGTLKMSGKAIPGRDVIIMVDGKSFAQVPAAEGDGAWSVEDKIALDDKVHAVSLQQIDPVTKMPAASAMFNMSLAPPTPADLAAPRPGR